MLKITQAKKCRMYLFSPIKKRGSRVVRVALVKSMEKALQLQIKWS
jgi:hypothetical protein